MDTTSSAYHIGQTIGIVFNIILLIYWITQIVDVARRQFPSPGTKTLWVIVTVVFCWLGAFIYSLVGKKQGTLPD